MGDAFLVRMTTAGDLDTSFGTFGGGMPVTVPLPALRPNSYGNDHDGPAIVLAPDGTFYLACATRTGAIERVAVAHLDATGKLDTAFGNAGWVIAGGAGNWAAYDAALQADGKLLVTGRGFSETTGTDFGWLRLFL